MGKQQDLVVADLPGEMDKDYEILQKAHSEYRTAGDRPPGAGGRGAPRPLIEEGPLPRAPYRRGGGRRQEQREGLRDVL